MAPGQRRRPTGAAAALIVAGLALLAWGCPSGEAQQRAALAAPATVAPRPPAIGRPPPPAGSLEEPLRRITADWMACVRERSAGRASERNVEIALHVRALESGVELAALSADRALRPASNMKLVTSAAALVLLGAEVDFVTPFEALGAVEDGTLRGDLVVRAAGDPLCDPQGRADVEGRLVEVCARLAARGVRRIQGDLVLDEGGFQTPGPGPGWPEASQHWAEYCARSGGFSVNGGVLRADVAPGRAGAPAHVEVHPAPHGLRSHYEVATGAGKTLDVRVGATISTVTVRGTLPAAHGPYAAEFAHPDPVALFGSVLRQALADAGVELGGELRRERGLPPGERLVELRSSLAETLVPINRDSRNGVADQLFLALGNALVGEGTREGGSRAVALALERLGVASTGLVQVDGSGLSRDNRVSARQITALLAGVLAGDARIARALRDSLAVAGRAGTLDERLRGTAAEGRVFAKTGWIAGASSLSGVLTTESGLELVFSILVSYPPELGGLNQHCFKPLQDALVLRLVQDGAAEVR